MTKIAVKQDIRKLTKDQLTDILVGMGEKKFRAKQVYEWNNGLVPYYE